MIPLVLAAPRDQLGEHLVRVVLGIWDSEAGTAAVALLRTAMTNDRTTRLLREFLTTQILRYVTAHLSLDPREATLRTTLAATQVLGVVIARHILHLEPIASAPVQHLAVLIGPTVHRYLTEPLPTLPTPPEAASYIPQATRA